MAFLDIRVLLAALGPWTLLSYAAWTGIGIALQAWRNRTEATA